MKYRMRNNKFGSIGILRKKLLTPIQDENWEIPTSYTYIEY